MAKKCLLFVEDYPVVQQIYVDVLKKEGFDVTVAPTGEDALKDVEFKHFDVVIVDLLLPKMSGIEFLTRFENLPEHDKSKVVVFTDFDDPNFIKKVYDLGISHYWMKVNNTPYELADKIKKVLKQK